VDYVDAADNPVLSVVVVIASDTISRANTSHLGPCLDSLLHQTKSPPMEILVPHHPFVDGIASMRERYPGVRFLEMSDLRTYTGRPGSREHHDELRARGLGLARGRIVALTEDHGVPAPDWAACFLERHNEPFAGVGGAIENAIDRPLNWAVFFCDFLRYQNPLPDGETPAVSDANVAYKREAMEPIRPVWQEVFHETSVNRALRARGEKLTFAPGAVLYQRRHGLTLRGALLERYVWGRSYGATRARLAGAAPRLFWAILAPGIPILILARMTVSAWKKRRTMPQFLKALPLTAALVAGWSYGEWMGYITGRANAAGSQVAEAIARGSQAPS
jgi:hypothetical protein